ncbi:MAG TPA: shikimate kinase [Streptosporangiaceae bacterium]|nr:shikimate kinase [Streptosporangiaceae bacterium]
MTTGGPGQPGRGTFPLVILIGPPGAGKTTVGGALAARLDVRFTDTDASIEAAAGKPVGDIFIDDGEPAFRELERAAVAAAIADQDGVVGLGGGAILDAGTRERLAGQPVVYLRTSFPELAKRVGMDRARPLLIGNPRGQLKALLDQRLPIYESLAWLTVDTDGREPADLAEQIAGAIGAPRPARPEP